MSNLEQVILSLKHPIRWPERRTLENSWEIKPVREFLGVDSEHLAVVHDRHLLVADSVLRLESNRYFQITV